MNSSCYKDTSWNKFFLPADPGDETAGRNHQCVQLFHVNIPFSWTLLAHSSRDKLGLLGQRFAAWWVRLTPRCIRYTASPQGLSCSQRKNNHSLTRHVPFSQLLQIKQQRERQINSPYGHTRYKWHNLQQVYIKAYKKFLWSFPCSPFQIVFLYVGCKKGQPALSQLGEC